MNYLEIRDNILAEYPEFTKAEVNAVVNSICRDIIQSHVKVVKTKIKYLGTIKPLKKLIDKKEAKRQISLEKDRKYRMVKHYRHTKHYFLKASDWC